MNFSFTGKKTFNGLTYSFTNGWTYDYKDGWQTINGDMGVPGKQDVADRVNYYFINKKGNCYCFAAAHGGYTLEISDGKVTWA